MYENRIRHLEIMHQDLDKRIDGMEKTGVFEDKALHELKKQRLQIRDQLADLRQRQQQHDKSAKQDE